MQGNIDNTRLLGERFKNSLPDPPYRVGNKLEILSFIEFLGGPDQPGVAFIDKVVKRKSLVLIIAAPRLRQNANSPLPIFQALFYLPF